MNNKIIFQENYEKYQNIYSPAIFLDRDGVIIKDQNYISDPSKVYLENGALDLIKKAYKFKWKVVVVTNQSGIARGYLNWNDYEKVTKKMIELLGLPNKITAIYANDVIDDEKCLTWRKPSPKMLFEASKDLKINLERSILIGDRYSDLLAGSSAGLNTLYHVLTGHGTNERSIIIEKIDDKDQLISTNYTSKVHLINTLSDFDYSIFQKNII